MSAKPDPGDYVLMSNRAFDHKCPEWTQPPPPPPDILTTLSSIIGFGLGPGGAYIVPFAKSAWWTTMPALGKRIIFWPCFLFLLFFGWLLELFVKFLGCKDPRVIGPALSRGIVGMADKWIGLSLNPALTIMDQQINTACPTEIMSPPEANQCFLMGEIDFVTWECLVRAQGYDATQYAPTVTAGRKRPGELDLLRLFREETIDEGAFFSRMGHLGWIKADEITDWRKAQDQYPTQSDLITMMVRDVADKDIVERFELHKEFDKKYIGRMVQYAKINGISEQVLLDYWAAHWQNISPGHLYEMLHRLNPAVRTVDKSVAVTKEDVFTALGQNDIPPFWRERLMAISYRPLGRIDTQRMYYLGVMNEQEVYESYLDEGYTPENSARMMEFAVGLRKEYDRIHVGGKSAQQIAADYANGRNTFEEATARMKELNIRDETIPVAFTWAQRRWQDESRMRKIRAIRMNYKRGVLGRDEANNALRDIGVEATQSASFLDEWDWIKRIDDKIPSLTQLCKWASMGILPAKDYEKRLRQMGYSAPDAWRIMYTCSLKAIQDYAKDSAAALQQQLDEYSKQLAAYNKAVQQWIKAGRQGPMPTPPPAPTQPSPGPTAPPKCVTDPCSGELVPVDVVSYVCGQPPGEVDECGNPVEEEGELPAE